MLIFEPQRDKRRVPGYARIEVDLLRLSSNREIVLPSIDSRQDDNNHGTRLEQESELDKDKDCSSISLAPGQTLPETAIQLRCPLDTVPFDYVENHHDSFSHPRFRELYTQLPNINLTYRDVNRWRMAWRAIQTFPSDTVTLDHLGNMLTRRPRDRPGSGSLEQFPVQLGFSAAAMIYGGLHILAWHAHFNSAVEQLLWRISAALVMGGLPVGFVLFFSVGWWNDVGDGLISGIPFPLNIILRELSSVTYCLFFGSVQAYILARAYLVVECFINLSHLPAGAYDVPQWSAYFPHIS